MELEGLSPSQVKKLGHPLKEIRERALKLLVAKLKLGWKMENEVETTRELLELLLTWFHVQKPTLQCEALLLLLNLIKSQAGNYVINEYGIKKLISNLCSFKHKIEPNTEELFSDIIRTLQFLVSVESEAVSAIPELNLQSISSSSCDRDVNTEVKNFNEQLFAAQESNILNDCDANQRTVELQDGINVLLFPWVQLCSSDIKTLHLIEDTFRLLKFTQRCCRFICDVFLHDFPPEIFLNRPSIIQSLLMIIDDASSSQVYEALYVLLCITKALAMRFNQLLCPELAHLTKSTDIIRSFVDEDRYQEELKILAEDSCHQQNVQLDDVVDPVLRQLPVPIYVLDTLHTLLSIMIRNIMSEEPLKKKDVTEMMELNISVLIVENLTNLLLACISDEFWKLEHSSKTQRDIAHKSCMAMRLLADLMNKYKHSFTEDNSRWHYRTAWLRLIFSAEKLLAWAHRSLLPSTLVLALQAAQIDPALNILYAKAAQKINDILQISNISNDQEFSKKHQEFCKLVISLEHAVQFIKNISMRSSKKILGIIKQSLPALEVHQSEAYVRDIGEIFFTKLKKWNMDDTDWSLARIVALRLMAHNCSWVQITFYKTMSESVKRIFSDCDEQKSDKEKDLYLLCDVGILTEVCCQGLGSHIKQVANSANEIMLYLLRGRLLLSEGCWWRLLASLLPILPLLHCYAAHETFLGQAICKSLKVNIAECMGIPRSEVIWGLVRLLYVKCPMVQMDAALLLCQLLDDEKYLPQKGLLRSDVLVNALRGVETHNFNVDIELSSLNLTQINAVIQIIDVLKQDIVIDENAVGFMEYYHQSHPVLEPSVRLSTLQQLSVLMRDPYSHETFIKHDGLQITVCLLRMALSVDDYLAFPDCALSCISILNSVCYYDRHSLAKIADLSLLLLRAILIFPSKDSLVMMASQVLSVTAWAGFALQELDRERKKVVALPKCVSENTTLPFPVQTYWSSSPNAVHSCLEWLLSEECWRSALRVRWACAWSGDAQILRDFSSSPTLSPPPGPLSLRMTADDLSALQSACPLRGTTRILIILQNASSHNQVTEAIATLEGYIHLMKVSSVPIEDLTALPWNKTMTRFLTAAPASPRDVTLLISLLKFIIHYLHNISSEEKILAKWIITLFIESNDSIVTLLSRRQLFPQQSEQENIEIIELHKHIVKILLHCVNILDRENNFEVAKIESLFKILLYCLEKIDLKDFHMLGYLNDIVRCLRYTANSRHCRPGEALIIQSLSQMNNVLMRCGAGDVGYKGQACRLDAMLTMLALVRRAQEENIPVQHWCESWSEEVLRAVCTCCSAGRPELRAAALRLLTALAHYTQLLPHLQQALAGTSLCKHAVRIFSDTSEADVVRAAAITLLSALCTRSSPYTNVYGQDIFRELEEYRFLDCCLEILADFSSRKEYKHQIERNVPLSVIDDRAKLEVRASKRNVSIQPLSPCTTQHSPSPGLVSALASCLYNMCYLSECPTAMWNDRGLFRLLFRCTWCSEGIKNFSATPVSVMCTNARRALGPFAQTNAAVRTTLANTRDCVHAVLYTLLPLKKQEVSMQLYEEYAQGLQLLGILFMDVPAAKSVWIELKNNQAYAFFCLIGQSLESSNSDFQDAGLYCLTRLIQSMEQCKSGVSDNSLMEFFDSIPAPQTIEIRTKYTETLNSDELADGERFREVTNCQPDYMAQSLCKSLIHSYRKVIACPMKVELSKDESWTRICSCLASMLCNSVCASAYAVHAGFPQTLLVSLQAVRDHLNLHGKPAEVIRNSNSDPILRTVYWILILIDSSMTECQAAKESFAENNIVNSLNKLWPWFMMTEELRETAMHLLQTFTNNCSKALVCMCACVGGRNLVGEVCALAQREAALTSRPHSPHLLIAALTILTHCTHHHHCRAIMLKTDVLALVYRVRCTERGRHTSTQVWTAWARLAEAASRHADGAARLLELRLSSAGHLARDLLLPALAHAAHHHRVTFLQSADLMDLLCMALMSGDPAQVVPAARAVWALAANNHKAKMTLRSAGVSAAVSCAFQRLQRSKCDSTELLGRAIHLLAYTDSILSIS